MGETTGGTSVGSYTVADLIPEALRQNLTRIVVGEVRGSEAGASPGSTTVAVRSS